MLGPNIIGDLANCGHSTVFVDNGTFTGPFAKKTSKTKSSYQEAGASQLDLTFNARNANALYGASTTVQPNATTALILIKF